MTRTRPNALVLLPTALLALATLSACTTGGLDANGCGVPGSVSDSISVSGDFGSPLVLESETPLSADGFQRSLLVEGAGAEIADGNTFVGQLNVFIGSSGAVYAQESTRQRLDTEQLSPWFYNIVNCAQEGDRIASVVSAVEVLGQGGGEDIGVSDDDTMVIVLDLRAVLDPGEGRAVGTEQALPEGFPGIVAAENGEPTIVSGEGVSSVGEPLVGVGIVGAGSAVEASHTVLVHYRSIVARTGEVIDDTWATGPVTMPLDGPLPVYGEPLIGQTVGSQVVILAPATANIAPEDLESYGLDFDDVLVYVVDILDAG